MYFLYLKYLEYINTGHLPVLPTVPMVHESVMLFGKIKFVIKWSRNRSDSQKITEASESFRLYNHILHILQNHF